MRQAEAPQDRQLAHTICTPLGANQGENTPDLSAGVLAEQDLCGFIQLA